MVSFEYYFLNYDKYTFKKVYNEMYNIMRSNNISCYPHTGKYVPEGTRMSHLIRSKEYNKFNSFRKTVDPKNRFITPLFL